MLRVGTVNIDTSHPMGFAESMKKQGRMHYVGVYNDSFRDDKEVEGFIKRYELEKRCGTIEELAELCDIGFVQGCDWDDHIRCMRPFIERNKPVFVDKPLVGCLKDCREIMSLAENGAVILGASSARYAYEIQEFLAIPKEERGDIVHVCGTAGVDEFNYGIHIVEAIGGLMGTGAEQVSWQGRGACGCSYSESYFIRYVNETTASFTTFTGSWQPFVLTIMTTKTTYQFKLNSDRLYDALMEEIGNYMEGRENHMADAGALLESVKIMLAAAASRERKGAPVKLLELTENGPSYDGRKFWKEYKAASGPMYA